jgi:predicted Zn-dependent protease
MLERLLDLLRACRQIDGFLATEEITESQEFFLIKHQLDMNRAKSVQKINLTVYKDCEVAGVKYKGAASVRIHPTMSRSELEKAIAAAAFAAGLVKNPYYPLVKPPTAPIPERLPQTHWRPADVFGVVPDLISALRETDQALAGWLNSAELFISRIQKRVINSEGVDWSGEQADSCLELIATWPGPQEEAELYRELHLATFTPEIIAAKARELLMLCQEKAVAVPTPALRKHTVLLTGEPVRELLNYYYRQTAARSVYEGISTFKPGTAAQGATIRGDRLNLTLDPGLANTTATLGFDADGVLLRPEVIIKDGVVLKLWGDQQYAHYLRVPVTGVVENTVFTGGSKTVAELKTQPYLELLAFSDFQTDPVTGDFGGEIRLGRYFDGHQVITVTGGSISGNIQAVQGELICSQERQMAANFSGPLTIQLAEVNVTGHA